MSYTVYIGGHKDFSSPEDARKFEEAVADLAREFASKLEGVTAATFQGGQTGPIDFLAEAAADRKAQRDEQPS